MSKLNNRRRDSKLMSARSMVVDEVKLYVKDVWVHVWSTVDVNSRKLLALYALRTRT